jgi:hypothetical protein
MRLWRLGLGALLVAGSLTMWLPPAATPVVCAQEAPPEAVPGPLPSPVPTPGPSGPSADDVGGAVGRAVLGGLTTALPRLIAAGLLQFLGELGHALYATMDAFFRGADVVTRLPAPWTIGHPVVQGLSEGLRWLANALLAVTFVGAAWQARRGGELGAQPAELPVAVMARVALGGVAVNAGLLVARPVLELVDAVFGWVANAPLPELIPGWAGAGRADLHTAEGIGLLLYGAECVLLWLHALGGVFYFDALLVLMPLAIWCETTGVPDLRHWFAVWAKAVGGAIGAKLALGVSLRLAVAFVQSGLLASSWPDVPAAVLALMTGGAGLLLTLKLASMGHQGVQMFHPFATAGRVAAGAGSASRTAVAAMALPFVGPAPDAAGPGSGAPAQVSAAGAGVPPRATGAGFAPGPPAPTP